MRLAWLQCIACALSHASSTKEVNNSEVQVEAQSDQDANFLALKALLPNEVSLSTDSTPFYFKQGDTTAKYGNYVTWDGTGISEFLPFALNEAYKVGKDELIEAVLTDPGICKLFSQNYDRFKQLKAMALRYGLDEKHIRADTSIFSAIFSPAEHWKIDQAFLECTIQQDNGETMLALIMADELRPEENKAELLDSAIIYCAEHKAWPQVAGKFLQGELEASPKHFGHV